MDIPNTSEALCRVCSNTDSQRDGIFTTGLTAVVDHATSEIVIGSKLSFGATKNPPAKASNAPGRRSSRWTPQ